MRPVVATTVRLTERYVLLTGKDGVLVCEGQNAISSGKAPRNITERSLPFIAHHGCVLVPGAWRCFLHCGTSVLVGVGLGCFACPAGRMLYTGVVVMDVR